MNWAAAVIFYFLFNRMMYILSHDIQEDEHLAFYFTSQEREREKGGGGWCFHNHNATVPHITDARLKSTGKKILFPEYGM